MKKWGLLLILLLFPSAKDGICSGNSGCNLHRRRNGRRLDTDAVDAAAGMDAAVSFLICLRKSFRGI